MVYIAYTKGGSRGGDIKKISKNYIYEKKIIFMR